MNQPSKVLVSIINWNNTQATNSCLESIARIPESKQPDIIVIDNHSTRDNLAIDPSVRTSLRSLKIVKNDENKGFGGGHNQNIRYAHEHGYDYIFLLNNDSEVIGTSLFDTLAEALANNTKALGANPTILSSAKPDIIWYGGGKLSLKSAYASHLRAGERYQDTAGQPQKVSLLTGGCLAISLKQAGLDTLLMPEEYFLYWEDTEWSARAVKAGFELLYVPQAKLLHYVSSSLGISSPTYVYYNIRNHFLFMRRNIAAIYWPLGFLRISFISLKYILNILFRYDRNRLAALGGLGHGWLDGLRGRSGKLTGSL
jgi:GT2 family glycosyltransferase